MKAGAFSPITRGKVCSIDGCEKPRIARGWCTNHYELWRRNGQPAKQERVARSECQADSCTKAPRSKFATYCETHYYRLRRNGTVETVAPRITGHCVVEGCGMEAAYTSGECRNHGLRVRRNGDYQNHNVGELNNNWTGDDATNSGVHQRVRKARGLASGYSCIDCGEQAQHWSYDHTDPNEKRDPVKGPYSLDIARYQPRCVKCHKRFDLDYLRRAPK